MDEFGDFWRGFTPKVSPGGSEGKDCLRSPNPSPPSPLQQELIERQKRKTAGEPSEDAPVETAADWAADMPDPFADD